MALMWGWGPFAIAPRGEEVSAGDRVRTAIRAHQRAGREGGEAALGAVPDLVRAGREMWDLVQRRIRGFDELPAGADTTRVLPSPEGTVFSETIREQLVFEVMAATIVACLLNIEYELENAKIMPASFPTQPAGEGVWEVQGLARDTTNNEKAREVGYSEKFDVADRRAVGTQFLVAAVRAYVEAVNSVAPFRPGEH